MPYAELPAVDRHTRVDLADARWASMLAARPEMAPAIALQRKLIGTVIDLAEALAVGRLPRLSLPPRYVTTKLGSGIPALAGEPVQLPVDLIQPALLSLARALAEQGGGEATANILTALDEGRIDVPLLLTLALRREQGALRVAATRAGLGHDLLWLIADLSVSPFAHALLRSLFSGITSSSPLAAALDRWTRGYCPLCGSWPALIEQIGEVRRLRCAFCAAAWDIVDRSCVYCGEAGSAFCALTTQPPQAGRVVETCSTCRGYTKVIAATASLPFPLLALADLESMDLDLLAMQHGCARPAIKQFARR